MGMDIIDKILEQLENGDWHKIDKISKNISLDPNRLLKLIEILAEIGFIKLRGDEIAITPMGIDYLSLPEE